MQALVPELTDRLLMLSVALVVSAFWLHRLRPNGWARRLEVFLLTLVKKLNRSKRSVATRVYRGLVLLLFAAVMAAILGYAIAQTEAISPWLELAEIALLAYLLPVRALRDEVAAVGKALKRKQLARAKGLASTLARREVEQLEAYGLLRVAMEYLAENYSDKLLAPIFWYLLLGLPGLCAVRMVNLLDSLIGHKSEQYRAFGWGAAKLDDVLMWAPARLSALLLTLAALFVPGGKPFSALQIALLHSHKTDSPNAGWPLAAMAGALGVSLGGPRRQAGAIVDDDWIGRGTARISYADFRRALALYAVASLMLLLAAGFGLSLLSKSA